MYEEITEPESDVILEALIDHKNELEAQKMAILNDLNASKVKLDAMTERLHGGKQFYSKEKFRSVRARIKALGQRHQWATIRCARAEEKIKARNIALSKSRDKIYIQELKAEIFRLKAMLVGAEMLDPSYLAINP